MCPLSTHSAFSPTPFCPPLLASVCGPCPCFSRCSCRHSLLEVAHPAGCVPVWASSALLVLFLCLSHAPLPASFQLLLSRSHAWLWCHFLPRFLVLSSSSLPSLGLSLSYTLALPFPFACVPVCLFSEAKNHFPKHTGGPRAEGLEQLHGENKKGGFFFFFSIHNRKNATGSQAVNSDLRKILKPFGAKGAVKDVRCAS